MGILDELFEAKITSKDVDEDADKIMALKQKNLSLWENHLSSFKIRYRLAYDLNYSEFKKSDWNIEKSLKIVSQIGVTLSPEIITIENGEKNEKEIIAEIKKLSTIGDIKGLCHKLIEEKNKEESMLKIFHEIHQTLKTELYIMKFIIKKPQNVIDMLITLRNLIRNNEYELYPVFMGHGNYDFQYNPRLLETMHEIAKAVLFREKWVEKKESADEAFAKELYSKMSEKESNNAYRTLGEKIFMELVDMIKDSRKEGDTSNDIEELLPLMENGSVMYNIIKKLRPKYSDEKIRIIIETFKECFVDRHFEDLEGELTD